MSLLRDAINAKATPHQRAAFAAEDWCRANPGWVRICDIPSEQYEDAVHPRWEELPAKDKASWIRNYHADAESAWLQYGQPSSYKVPVGYILDDGHFVTRLQFHTMDLADRGFMMVFKLGANQ